MKNHFVHANGICESEKVGNGTKIWAFAHVLSGASIGADCNICDHVFIENDVVIGNRVTIKSGVQIWDGTRIGDDVFIGPNATFTNDRFPRSKDHPEKYLETIIENGASIGANATLLPGIRIGSYAMIGAGAVVTRDVPPNSIVAGNPARINGYVQKMQKENIPIYDSIALVEQGVSEPHSLGVGSCQLWPLKRFRDLRGEIVPIEFNSELPFYPKRQFFVFAVPSYRVRGEHAHKQCKQFMIVIHGELHVVVDNGNDSCEVRLSSPDVGLFVPAGIWAIQYKFSSDALLAVYASDLYDPADYIRNYDEFKKYIAKKESSSL
jgi:acetyltransferase-like isoleucine patch superfamily enzyme/dTDP-4-dehydrorhamnose 3,5-epimerase-like enzyme